MTFRQAKKLHNEDEVILKTNGEVLHILNTHEEINEVTGKQKIIIEAVGTDNQYVTVSHKEVR